MEIDIIIDTLTDCLICAETGEERDTEYRLVSKTITKQDANELKGRDGSSIGAFLIRMGMRYMSCCWKMMMKFRV